jgi:malonyl-CoA/methylmalonyl-CoA synthetase
VRESLALTHGCREFILYGRNEEKEGQREKEMTAVSELPLIARARGHADRTAIVAPEGVFTYRQLLDASARVATALLDGAGCAGAPLDLRERRVAFLTPPGFEYPAVQWGIWRAGGIAVPLCVSHPRPELEYVILDSDAEIVVAHPAFEEILGSIAREHGRRFLTTPAILSGHPRGGPLEAAPGGDGHLPRVDDSRRALILYTSGTTSKPKGVVTTHRNIAAQVTSLITAWEWSPEDRILHVLPLHHIHGIINVLTCALWAGACCQLLPRFAAEEVWDRLIEDECWGPRTRGRRALARAAASDSAGGRAPGAGTAPPLTLFMAVPTIYVRLIAAWEAAPPERQRAMTAACARLRLMVSGSAALPVPVLEKWQAISGHVLLERYGMTEIGMGISNPLHGPRVPGHVGAPLPGVEVRRVDDEGNEVGPDTPGEIQVRGPGVFHEYWRKPEATQSAFRDGWFCTGDVAVVEEGSYRILGRSSVDIIKTGGYKVSALEIEEVLLGHPQIAECAVVGVEDLEWGERVGAAVVTRDGMELTLEALRAWGRERLAVYKIPSRLLVVDALPRNAMGKVTKPDVVRLFQADA